MTSTMIYYFFSYFTVSLVLSLVLVPLARSLSFKVGAVDRGEGRRVHTGIVPRLGGIAIFFAFALPMIFSLTRGVWDGFHNSMVGILIASSVVLCVGIYDDIKGATVRNKLLAEILAASIIFSWGIRITVISNPFGSPFELGWLSFPVTVLWIIVITNAINLIDGLDGLAAGTGILIAATFFFMSGSDTHLQLTHVILAGVLLGFLRYNFPPASIFMGDSGSLFVGFFLGATSILSAFKATAIVTIMVPLIAFSFPLMDMFYAVLRRYYRGMPLGEADREHIHHKLIDKGLTKNKVLLLLYAGNTALLVLALIVVRQQLNLHFLALAGVAVVAIAGLRLLGYVEFIPQLKEMMHHHALGKKRKYFYYIIRKFRKSAQQSRSFGDLVRSMNELMNEYDFTSAEIRLGIPGAKDPLYYFSKGICGKECIRLAFPLVGKDEKHLGEIVITRQMDTEHFLCISEMIAALSGEIGSFFENHPKGLLTQEADSEGRT